MASREKAIVSMITVVLLAFVAARPYCQEQETDAVAIKMVLRNYQVKAIRKAKGQLVSIKLSGAQKKLIRVRAPKFRGYTIRISTAHLRKGSNKIDLLLIKPTSSTPILRVLPPIDG